MKYLRLIALVVFFHIVMNMFMPWWNIFFAGIIAGYFSRLSSNKTFITVLASLSLYWIFLIFKIDKGNDYILSSRLVEMFQIPNRSILLIINGFLGGLAAAFGSMVGYYIRKIVKQGKSKSNSEEQMDLDDYKETQPEWRDADLM